MIFVKS